MSFATGVQAPIPRNGHQTDASDQTDRQTVRQTDRQTDKQAGRQVAGRQTERQTDKNRNRQTDRQTDRQTEGCTHRPPPVDCLFLTSSTVRRLVGRPLRSAQRGQDQSPSASSSHSSPMHSRWKLRGQVSHRARGLPSGWCICKKAAGVSGQVGWVRPPAQDGGLP